MQVARPDVLATALGGISAARGRLADDAAAIAEDPWELDAIVDLQVQEHAVAANAAVIRSVDRTYRSLLDILA